MTARIGRIGKSRGASARATSSATQAPPGMTASGASAKITAMTKEQLKAIFERVLAWPPERQDDAANMLLAMEAQDNSPHRLTDEQAAEVRRRLAEPNPETLTLDEFKERLRRFDE